MVDTGNEPPLRAFRANAALVKATAELRTAEAEERTARRSLAAILGSSVAPAELVEGDMLVLPASMDLLDMLDVRLVPNARLLAQPRLRGKRADCTPVPVLGSNRQSPCQR